MLRVRSTPVRADDIERVRRHAAVGLRSFVTFDRRGVRDLMANGVSVRPGAANAWTPHGSVAQFFADGSTAVAVFRSRSGRRGGRTFLLKLIPDPAVAGLKAIWDYFDGTNSQGYWYLDSTSQPGYDPATGLGGVRGDFEVGYHHLAARYDDVGPKVTLHADGHLARSPVNPVAANALPAAMPATNRAGWNHGGNPLFTYVGTIAWQAEFSRPLSRDEVMWWATDGPFLDDDEILTAPGPAPTVVSFSTGCSAEALAAADADLFFETGVDSGAAGTAGLPASYATAVALAVALGGSLQSPPPGTLVFGSGVQATQTLAAEVPTVVTFATATDASAATVADEAAYFANGVSVRGRAGSAIDGRFDLLGTLRYRR